MRRLDGIAFLAPDVWCQSENVTEMANYRHILHPTDFSATSDEALQHAVSLAREHQGDLILLHVVHSPDLLEELSQAESLARVEHERRRQLADLARELRNRSIRCETMLVTTPAPAQEILEIALRRRISLIVMGTHGRGLQQRTLNVEADIGSTAEKVVRMAPCSVLTVRPGTGRAPGIIRNILVPVDFSPYSRLAFGVARRMALKHGARVDVLHVVEPFVRPAFYHTSQASERAARDLDARIQMEVEEIIRRAGGSIRHSIHVRRGRPDEEIVRFAGIQGTHLIVQGSRGLSGLNYLLLGSVAERVVRSAPCPVLTVKGRKELIRRRVKRRQGEVDVTSASGAETEP